MQAKLISLVLGASLIAACETPSGQGAGIGAVGGGIIGGALGGGTGLLVGAAVGGMLGFGVGKQIEENDRREVAMALEADREMSWRNSRTGYHYDVEPMRTVVQEGQQCREFKITATDINNTPKQVYRTACRQPGGDWELVRT